MRGFHLVDAQFDRIIDELLGDIPNAIIYIGFKCLRVQISDCLIISTVTEWFRRVGALPWRARLLFLAESDVVHALASKWVPVHAWRCASPRVIIVRADFYASILQLDRSPRHIQLVFLGLNDELSASVTRVLLVEGLGIDATTEVRSSAWAHHVVTLRGVGAALLRWVDHALAENRVPVKEVSTI